MTRLAVVAVALGMGAWPAPVQLVPRVEQLVAAVRPALPFPGASDDGEEPASGGAQSRWFVVWPADQDTRIIVKANPLHPEVQAAAALAMGKIQQAVFAAELKAQAAYDRALAKLRAGAETAEADGITLDDEGVAGERIDAELELRIELMPSVQPFDIATSEAPVILPGTKGVTWVVSIAANTYRESPPANAREHFTPAEVRLYFGPLPRPTVNRRGSSPHFTVSVASRPDAFAVVVRGNADLLDRVVQTADWSVLGTP